MRGGYDVLFVCLFCSLLLLQPILSAPSWYYASQSYRYPYLLVMFKEQFLAGHWYPRWLPGLMGGYGYPTFVYYPPGFWFLSLPLALLISNPLVVIKLMLVLLMTLGGLGAYRLARCFCNAGTALLACTAYYLTPELGYQLYATGDFAELTAMLLVPWVFYYLIKFSDHIKHGRPCLREAVWFSITLSMVAYCHAIITVWLGVTLVICIAGRAADCHLYRTVATVSTLAIALAMALSSPYWFPAFTLRDHADFGTSLYVFSIQSVRFSDLFAFTSSRAGLLLPLLACAGFFYGRRSRFMAAVALCSALCVFYMLPASLPLRGAFPALRYLQDPQRVLPVLATLQLIGIAFFLGYAELRWPWDAIRKAGVAVLGLLILAGSDHYNPKGYMNYTSYYMSRTWAFEDMTNTHEFRPKRASTHALEPRARRNTPIATLDGPANAHFTAWSKYPDDNVELSLVTDGLVRMTFNQFYFPGWNVTVNGQTPPFCPTASQAPSVYCIDANGRMVIFLHDAGDYQLHIWYGGVPYAFWRNAVALLVSVLSVLALRKASRPQPISA